MSADRKQQVLVNCASSRPLTFSTVEENFWMHCAATSVVRKRKNAIGDHAIPIVGWEGLVLRVTPVKIVLIPRGRAAVGSNVLPLKKNFFSNEITWQLKLHLEISYSTRLTTSIVPSLGVTRVSRHAKLKILNEDQRIFWIIEAFLSRSGAFWASLDLHVSVVVRRQVSFDNDRISSRVDAVGLPRHFLTRRVHPKIVIVIRRHTTNSVI